MIVDTHVHIVSGEPGRFPLRPSPLGRPWWSEDGKDAEALIGLMGRNGVDKAFIVQPVGAYGFDNSYLLHVAARSTGHVWAVPALDLDDENLGNAEIEQRLSELARAEGVAGVRFFAVAPGSEWTEDLHRTRMALVAARERDLVAVLTVFPEAVGRLRPLIEELPDLRVALDHCGFPDLAGGRIPSNAPLLSLASCPNVALKVSSHVLRLTDDPAGLVARLAGIFGDDRIMWGSDYPQTDDDYPAMLELARAASNRLGDDGATRFLGLNARRFFEKP